MKKLAIIGATTVGVAAGVAILAVFSLVLAWPFMWMWNYAVVSALTIAKPIGYWVAFWLMLFIGVFCLNSNTKTKAD